MKQTEAQRLVSDLKRRANDVRSVDGIYVLITPGKIDKAAALIRRQDKLLEQALSSLKELVPDPQTDFGPAYEGAKQRQKKVITAIRAHLEAK